MGVLLWSSIKDRTRQKWTKFNDNLRFIRKTIRFLHGKREYSFDEKPFEVYLKQNWVLFLTFSGNFRHTFVIAFGWSSRQHQRELAFQHKFPFFFFSNFPHDTIHSWKVGSFVTTFAIWLGKKYYPRFIPCSQWSLTLCDDVLHFWVLDKELCWMVYLSAI